jgi:hypothetical protein
MSDIDLIKRILLEQNLFVEQHSSNNELWLDLGSIPNGQVVALQQLINLMNYRRIIDRSGLKHIANQHGNQLKETSRGQIQITPTIIATYYPLVVNQPDTVSITTTKKGEPAIHYLKRIDNVTVTVIEVVRSKRKKVCLHTMFIKKAAL